MPLVEIMVKPLVYQNETVKAKNCSISACILRFILIFLQGFAGGERSFFRQAYRFFSLY